MSEQSVSPTLPSGNRPVLSAVLNLVLILFLVSGVISLPVAS